MDVLEESNYEISIYVPPLSTTLILIHCTGNPWHQRFLSYNQRWTRPHK